MELQPPTAPLPPLLATVRSRHPDADVVVLPSDGPPGPAPDPVDDATVAAVVAEVSAVAGDLAGGPVEARVAYGSEEGTVRVVAQLVVPTGDTGIRDLRDRLAADGWEVRRFGPGRLVGRRGGGAGHAGLHLRAAYSEARGALLVDLTSTPLAVGHDRARGLVKR